LSKQVAYSPTWAILCGVDNDDHSDTGSVAATWTGSNVTARATKKLHVVIPPELTAEDLLTAIIEGSQDAIVASDLDGLIISWNPAAVAMFGYAAHEVLGKNMYHMVPLDAERLQDDVFRQVYAGHRVEHYETQLLAKDGSVRGVSLNVSPLHDQRGTIAGVCTVVRDISERIAIEADRERARIALDLSHQAVVHDLKGPLGMTGVMIAEAQTRLGTTEAEGSCAQYLDLAGTCIEQMQVLIDDVLLLHRVYDLDQRQPVDVASLVQQTADSIIGVELELGELPTRVVAHEHALLRMFRNLLENAVKHAAGADGTAHVRASGSATDTHWQLNFEDDGPGISEPDLAHVFEPFYRGAERSNLDGTGLGPRDCWCLRQSARRHCERA